MDEHFISFAVTETTTKYSSTKSQVRSSSKGAIENDDVLNTRSTGFNQVPWMINVKNQHQIPYMIQFHNEIIQFCRSVYPSNSEMMMRENVITKVDKICKSIWPDCKINVFGSQQTKILTCTSDIDISILNVPIRDMSLPLSNQENSKLKTELECLYLLANKFKDSQFVSYVEVVGNAKVRFKFSFTILQFILNPYIHYLQL